MPEYTNDFKESSASKRHIAHQITSAELNSKPHKISDDAIRWFLVKTTVTLMFLVLGLYLITRDKALLLTTTFVSVVVLIVFRYYFRNKEK